MRRSRRPMLVTTSRPRAATLSSTCTRSCQTPGSWLVGTPRASSSARWSANTRPSASSASRAMRRWRKPFAFPRRSTTRQVHQPIALGDRRRPSLQGIRSEVPHSDRWPLLPGTSTDGKSMNRSMCARLSALIAVAIVLHASTAPAQVAVAPVNDRPNPYQTIEGWAKLPDGRTWGSTSAVDVDKDGTSIWVAERCGTNSCVGSPLDPVLKFDANGTLVAHFGAGMLASPHGIAVDKDGNVWVTDCSCTSVTPGTPSAPPNPGHQSYKFSPPAKLLMTLGKPGGGRDTVFFWQPNDVLVAPNGDISVAEGHTSAPTNT